MSRKVIFPKHIEGNGAHASYYHAMIMFDSVRIQNCADSVVYLKSLREIKKLQNFLDKAHKFLKQERKAKL